MQIGKSGFCTVASTHGMAANLARLLESLSGYRHLHPPGSAEAKKNPIIYSHLKATVGGRPVHVLSRICDAGFDYSNRSNKLAHHLAVREPKSQAIGPAAALVAPGHFHCSWDQDPAKIDPRPLSGQSGKPQPCATWQSVSGDAGWAGDLIEAVQKRRQAYLIVNESTPSIQLIQEALALLPVHKQWGVTFSTFFTKLPPKIECNIRCVMAGSPEVAIAKRSQANFVLDLTQSCGRAASSLADSARQGKLIGDSGKPSTLSPSLGKPELAIAPDSKPTKAETAKPKHSVRHDVEDDLEEYDLVEVPPQLRGGKAPRAKNATRAGEPPSVKKQAGIGKWIGIAGAFLLLAGLSSLLFLPGVRESISSFGKSEKPEENTVPNPESTEDVEQKLKAEEEQKALGKLKGIRSELNDLARNHEGLEDDLQRLRGEIKNHSKQIEAFQSEPFKTIKSDEVSVVNSANESFNFGIPPDTFWNAVKTKVASQLNDQYQNAIELKRNNFRVQNEGFRTRAEKMNIDSKANIIEFQKLESTFTDMQLRKSEIQLKELGVTLKDTEELIASRPREINVEVSQIRFEDEIAGKLSVKIGKKSEALIEEFKQQAIPSGGIRFAPHNKHLYEMHAPKGIVFAKSTSEKENQHPFGMELTLAKTDWTKKNADDSPSLLPEPDLNKNWLERTSLNTWEIHPNAIASVGSICFERNRLILKIHSEEKLAETFEDKIPDAVLTVTWDDSGAVQRFYFRPPKRYLRIIPEGFFSNRNSSKPLIPSNDEKTKFPKFYFADAEFLEPSYEVHLPKQTYLPGIVIQPPVLVIEFLKDDSTGKLKFCWRIGAGAGWKFEGEKEFTPVSFEHLAPDAQDLQPFINSFGDLRETLQPRLNELNQKKELNANENKEKQDLIRKNENLNSAIEKLKTKTIEEAFRSHWTSEGDAPLIGPVRIRDASDEISIFLHVKIDESRFETMANNCFEKLYDVKPSQTIRSEIHGNEDEGTDD